MANCWLNVVWPRTYRNDKEKMFMLAIADRASDDGFAYPGNKELALRCQCSPRQITRIRTTAIEAGHIQSKSRAGGQRDGGKGKSLLVLLCGDRTEAELSALWAARSEAEPLDQGGHPDVQVNEDQGGHLSAPKVDISTLKVDISTLQGRHPDVHRTKGTPAAEPRPEPEDAPARAATQTTEPEEVKVLETAAAEKKDENELEPYSKNPIHAVQQIVADFGGDEALRAQVSACNWDDDAPDRVYAVLHEAFTRFNGTEPRNPGGVIRESLRRARLLP